MTDESLNIGIIMKYIQSWSKIFTLLLFSVLFGTQLHAVTFDWETEGGGWPDGALSKAYTDVAGSGIDMNVTVTGSTGELIDSTPKTDANGLTLHADYTDESHVVTLTMRFATPIKLTSLKLKDFDDGTYVDRAVISAVDTDGNTITPSGVILGAGVKQNVAGDYESKSGETNSPGDARGQVDVEFTDVAVTEISWTYQNGTAADTDPDQQFLWIDPVFFVPVGSIVGHIYDDANGDGIQNGGESNISNATVNVTSSLGNTYTVTTDANGNYFVENISTGDANVSIDVSGLGVGYVQTEGTNPTTVTVVKDVNTTEENNGFQQQRKVTGHLYEDVDGDGTQDPGEDDLSGVTVAVTDSDGVVHAVTTGVDGNFTATGLSAGDATVEIALPGSTQTEGTNPTTVSTVVIGNNVEENNGFQLASSDLCTSGIEIFASAYHSTVVSTATEVFAFGQDIDSDGATDVLSPKALTPAEGYNYTGDVLQVTDATHDTQAFLLSTDGLYVWGASGGNADPETAISTNEAFHQIDMPVGLSPSDVTYLTATNGGVFLVANGRVYAQGVNSTLMGGGSADANGWYTVEKSAGVPLEDVEYFKAHYSGAFAVTTDAKYYTWGQAVYLGDGSAQQSLAFATQMTVPYSGAIVKLALTGYYDEGVSYYVLNPADTKIYALGNNDNGQLGVGSTTEGLSWAIVQKSSGVDLVGVKEINADDNSDHYPTAGAIVDDYDGDDNVFVVWGRNSSDGLSEDAASNQTYPMVPKGFTPGTSYARRIEMGGHTTMFYDPNYTDDNNHTGKMCYVGHRINGSMGDGSSADEQEPVFNCEDTPWLSNACAAKDPTGLVAGSVKDTNGNALAGVSIKLMQGATVIASTLTDVNGSYEFADVLLGDYNVTSTNLLDYMSVSDISTDNQTDNSSPTDDVIPVTVTWDEQDRGNDFVDAKTWLTGHVYSDLNNNGTQDGADIDLSGITVNVTDSNGVTYSVLTDADGNYAFYDIASGTATVSIVEPLSGVQTEGTNPTDVTVDEGVITVEENNGFFLLGTVIGHIYDDIDGSGTQDPGENDLSGVTVTVVDSDGVSHVVTTGADGNYTATDVSVGGDATVTIDTTTTSILNGATQTQGTNPTTVTNVQSGINIEENNGFTLPPNLFTKQSVTEHTPVQVNDQIDYNIILQNNGSTTLTNVNIADSVPAGTTYVPGSGYISYYDVSYEYYVIADNMSNLGDPDSYTQIDGNATGGDWETGWTETGEGTDADGGNIRMRNDAGKGASDDEALRIEPRNTNRSIQRTMDLSSYSDASLTYKYRVDHRGNPSSIVILEISNNNGASYSELKTYTLTQALEDSTSDYVQEVTFDISSYISAQTIIRFRVGDTTDNDRFYVDDVRVNVTQTIVNPHTDQIDPNNWSSTNYTSYPQYDINATFQVTVNNPATLTEINNTATLNADGVSERNATTIDPMAYLSGHLYNDLNGNGSQDASDTNLSSVDIVITDAAGTVHVVTTNTNGDYLLIGLSDGDAVVDINESDPDFPAGSVQTEGTDPTTVTIVPGANTEENNGYHLPFVASITDSNVTEGTDETHTVTMSGAASTDKDYPFALDDNYQQG